MYFHAVMVAHDCSFVELGAPQVPHNKAVVYSVVSIKNRNIVAWSRISKR